MYRISIKGKTDEWIVTSIAFGSKKKAESWVRQFKLACKGGDARVVKDAERRS